jgi:hypothetical protein
MSYAPTRELGLWQRELLGSTSQGFSTVVKIGFLEEVVVEDILNAGVLEELGDGRTDLVRVGVGV